MTTGLKLRSRNRSPSAGASLLTTSRAASPRSLVTTRSVLWVYLSMKQVRSRPLSSWRWWGKDNGLDDRAIIHAVQKHMFKCKSPVMLRFGINHVNGKYMVRALQSGKCRPRS